MSGTTLTVNGIDVGRIEEVIEGLRAAARHERTVRVDGPTFARTWLAVSAAASTNPDQFHLYRAVSIEVHTRGLRLTSMRGALLVTGWVPYLDEMGDDVDGPDGDAPVPPFEVAPIFSATVRDLGNRGQGLLKYVLKLLGNFLPAIRTRPGLVPLDVTFGVEVEPPAHEDTPLDGMAPRFLALELPDAETVFVPELTPDTFPDWRRAFDEHRRASAAVMAWSPEVLGLVAEISRHVSGEVRWTLSGSEGNVRLEFASRRPVVFGLAAPRRGADHLPTVVNLDPREDDEEDEEDESPGPDDVELPLDDDDTT